MTNHHVNLGLKGILNNYPKKYFIKGLWIPLILTITTLYLANISPLSHIDFLSIFISRGLSVMGLIFGSTMTAFVLSMAFGDKELVRFLSKKNSNEELSQYNQLNGIFGVALLSQALVLIGFFLITTLIDLKLTAPPTIAKNINTIALSVSLLSLYYALWFLKDLVINLHNIWNLYEYSVWRTQKNERKPDENGDVGS